VNRDDKKGWVIGCGFVKDSQRGGGWFIINQGKVIEQAPSSAYNFSK